MKYIILGLSIMFLLLGHIFKIIRWEKFINIYEKPSADILLKSLSLGYAINFIIPFRCGDLFRAVYSGKHMKNGIGFSLATVILDRLLDIIAVFVIFFIFYLTGIKNDSIYKSIIFYIFASGVITGILLVIKSSGQQIKRITLAVCSIFNDTIKLKCLKFFWTLINAFRDISKINPSVIILDTILMWGGYMISYAFFAQYLSETGYPFHVTGLFTMLFSRSNLEVSTFAISTVLGSMLSKQQQAMAFYMIVPIILIWGITYLPISPPQTLENPGDDKTKNAVCTKENNDNYLQILPQINQKDQLAFLDQYFNSRNQDILKKFIGLNRNISIIRDYSAGSNATTMLCMNRNNTFYRKYAFGDDGKKLSEQLKWLKKHSSHLPLCKIIYEYCDEDCCCYDMDYDSKAVSMFRYIHSHPIQNSTEILAAVLDHLMENLYNIDRSPADRAKTEQYLISKVDANLEKLRQSKLLRELLNYEVLVINGVPYKNISALRHLFHHQYLQDVFKYDQCCSIHGDLTIENIICISMEKNAKEAYYLIDPNTGNIHDSMFLDFGKLLQSLHGGYEFMMMTKSVSVTKNHIDFLYTKSSVYDEMFKFLKQYMENSFSSKEISSIFHHELIHWLRLMPYKIKNDPKRAAMFYAGLVMVANDVERWFK